MKGFFKQDGDELLFAPNFIINKNYELKIDSFSEYNYPVDGWFYFESEEEAKNFFGTLHGE